MDFSFLPIVQQGIRGPAQGVKHLLRRWTRPSNDAPVLNTAVDLTRSKAELGLENALLRQQLVVLHRNPKAAYGDQALAQDPAAVTNQIGVRHKPLTGTQLGALSRHNSQHPGKAFRGAWSNGRKVWPCLVNAEPFFCPTLLSASHTTSGVPHSTRRATSPILRRTRRFLTCAYASRSSGTQRRSTRPLRSLFCCTQWPKRFGSLFRMA